MSIIHIVQYSSQGYASAVCAFRDKAIAEKWAAEGKKACDRFNEIADRFWQQVNEVWGPKNLSPHPKASPDAYDIWSAAFQAEKERVLIEMGIDPAFLTLVIKYHDSYEPHSLKVLDLPILG
jgi:hypothetical protein